MDPRHKAEDDDGVGALFTKIVMAGLVPTIHAFFFEMAARLTLQKKAWIPGSSPGMT